MLEGGSRVFYGITICVLGTNLSFNMFVIQHPKQRPMKVQT